MTATTPFALHPSRLSGRCHGCRRREAAFVFQSRKGLGWIRRCGRCAEQMVKDGRATYAAEASR
jgi:hypothetical protein